MAISIYNKENLKQIATLSEDNWSLISQLFELEDWLKNLKDLEKGNYIADIGYSSTEDIRDAGDNAFGGGFALGLDSINKLASNNIELWFSVYS